MDYKDIEEWFDSNKDGSLRNSNSSSHLEHLTKYVLEKCKFQKGSKILEIGCGDGLILASIEKKRPDLVLSGIDLSKIQIKKAQSLLPKIEFFAGNFLDVEISSTFDAIFSFSTFQYIKRDDINKFNKKCLDLIDTSGKVSHLSIPNTSFRREYYYKSLKNSRNNFVAFSMSLIKNLSQKYGKDGSNWHNPNYIKGQDLDCKVCIDSPSDSWYRFNFHLIK